jgi:hypothetical protein
VTAQERVERLIVERARAQGGRCFLNYGEASAAMRLTERGVGHWEQFSPFVAAFVLAAASSSVPETEQA